MTINRDPEVQRRVQQIFELYELAENMMLTNLWREFPEASDEEIRQRMIAWRHQREYEPPEKGKDG